jgi:beta-glucosidase
MVKMQSSLFVATILFLVIFSPENTSAQTREAIAVKAPNPELASDVINRKVDALLEKMTLEEKVGQMVQYPPGNGVVGPQTQRQDFDAMITRGEIGALNVADRKRANAYQRSAIEKSRLHIPLIFGLDVIHGYHTIYPIPLGLAASFDPDLVAAASRLAAQEASADGIRMVNSPMVDIALDARWGRVAEGAGESTYLGSIMARAYVHGYQGRSLSDPSSVAACVKHFAAYGAAISGRDYNATDMSDITLRQVYLPPYHAAIAAGAAAVMSSFNSLNSVPETADPYTLTQILRKEWGFAGFVRSDYNAVAELMEHGIALDSASAARKAALAGLDMDMASSIYHNQLARLVRSGAVPETAIDEAVRRILRVKFALGLFDHPYVSEDTPAYQATAEKRSLARKAAEESFVLLRNEARDGRPLLPIPANVKTIALIGPLADANSQMLGTWNAKGNPDDVVSLRSALDQRMRQIGGKLLFAEGTQIVTDRDQGFDDAKQAAHNADLVIMALGEDALTMTGEAASRADLGLPGNQERLLEEIVATGKPVVLIVFSGRPLVLNWAAEHVGSILEAWFPGIEAGSALTEVLFGDAAPSGKLPVSFPRAVGQEPLYLSQFSTGRPAKDADLSRPPSGMNGKFVSRYIDVPNAPLYPFGYGLSYTTFDYSPVTLNTREVHLAQLMTEPGVGVAQPAIRASATVTNSGKVSGAETVQLYIQIRGASMVQPVRVLEGFQRVTLRPGESKRVEFPLSFDELSIINAHSQQVVEPSEYTVYVGDDSDAKQNTSFKVIN